MRIKYSQHKVTLKPRQHRSKAILIWNLNGLVQHHLHRQQPTSSGRMNLDAEKLFALFGDRRAPDGTLARDNFAKWFGKSQALGVGGEPLILFHGTDEPSIDRFFGCESIGWFSEDPEFASKYADERRSGAECVSDDGSRPNVLPVFLRIENPLCLDFDMNDSAEVTEEIATAVGLAWKNNFSWASGAYEVINNSIFLTAVEKAGFDGVRIKERGSLTWAPMNCSQIKSATGNSGMFDPNSEYLIDLPRDAAELSAEVHEPERMRA